MMNSRIKLKRKALHIFALVIMLFLTLNFTLGFSINIKAQPSEEVKNKIVVIYKDNLYKAEVLQTWLDDQGYNTTLVNVTDIMAGIFEEYDLIVAGRDSGYRDEWGNGSIIAIVNDTLKPILGIGEGGAAFFGKLGLDIGYPHNSYSSQTSLIVMNESHTIFNIPNEIPNGTIQIFTQNSNCVQYGAASPPSDVEVFATIPYSTTDYVICQQAGRYFFWGFDGSPDFFTDVGENLFLNVLIYLGLEPIPIDNDGTPNDNPLIPGYNVILLLSSCIVLSIVIFKIMLNRNE